MVVLSKERMHEIQNKSKQIYFNNLIYYFTTPRLAPISFIRFKCPMHIYSNVKNGEKSMEKIEEDQLFILCINQKKLLKKYIIA